MRTTLFLGVLAFVIATSQQVAQAQDDAPGDLSQSAASLDQWLGTDANGQKWRDYLLLKSLRAEVAGDREADPAALVEVWRRFTSGEAGLEGKRFQAVRVDLENYLNKRLQLARSQVAALAKDAAANYVAPAPAAIASAEAELRQAAIAANAYLGRLPVAQRSRAREHLGDQALTDWAAGRKPTDEQLTHAAQALGKYKWRKYEQKYVELANRDERVKLQELNEADKVNGLEGSVYTRLRTALDRLQNLRTALAEKDAEMSLKTRIEELAGFVKEAEDKVSANYAPVTIRPDPEEKMLPKALSLPPELEAAKRLGELQATGQATPLRQELFRGFSLPNLVVYTSGEFFAAGLNQEINRIRPINDVILGTSVHGTAHVVGETRTQMLTNPLQAGYSINLGAVANSNTVGYNGPVTIFSTGVTQLHGQKKIHFDDEIGGMRPSPATASASTCTSINNICARSRLVTRIAWKRAMASKGAAEAEASAKAAANLRTEMNQQAVESTGNVNKNFEERYRVPLIIRGEYPRQFLTASSSKLMQVVISQLDQGQLGAPTAPPPTPAGDVVAQIHESFVANYGRAMLGGQTFTALEIRQMMEQLGGKVPDLQKVADEQGIAAVEDGVPEDEKARQRKARESEAVTKLATSYITFDDEVPVRVEFRSDPENPNPELRGDLLHIVLRIDKLERAKRDDPSGKTPEVAAVKIEVSALYRIEREFPNEPERGDYVLRRQKMNEEEPIGEAGRRNKEPIVDRGVYSAFLGPRVRLDGTALYNLTNRFRRDVFPVEIKLGPLKFEGRQKQPPGKDAFGNWSKLDPLPTTTAESASGWLTLGWTMQPWKFKAQRPAAAEPVDEKPAADKPADDKPAN